jgi:hypothetical protein
MIGAIDTVIARVIARVVGTAAVSSAESAALFDAKVAEIQRLLAEAYRHYFEHSNGYAKSGEGALSIHLPSYFWEANVENTPCVEIFSYVFGSGRHHSFTDIDEALAQVRTWHAEEMVYDHIKTGVRQMGETLGSGLTCGGHIHIEHPEPSAPERLRRFVEDLGDQVQYDANRQPLEWGDRMAVLLLEDARLMLIRVANNINPPSYFDLMTKIGQLEHMTRF